MGWKNLIDEGWKPPYLACIKCNGSFSGSGLLVGPRHVLTALHVLGVLSDPSWSQSAADNRSSTMGEPLPAPSPSLRLEVSFASSPTRIHVGRCVDFDRFDDIALIELDSPFHGVAMPRFADAKLREQQAVAALGFIGQGTGRMPAFRGHSGKASLDTAFKDGGRDLHYQVSYGGQGGFSGGPVFLADDGPCPRLIGMSRLGGDGLDHGKIVAAALLRDWLRERLPDLSIRPPAAERHHAALIRGFEPFYRVAPGWDFLFAAIDQADPTAHRQTFVAFAPLSRAAAKDGADPVAVLDAERPAHFASPASLSRGVDRLGRLHGAPFRLPTADEVSRLGALANGRPFGNLLGEAVTMRRFVDDDGGPRSSPDGTLEWLATPSGPEVREHRGGSLRTISAEMRPRARLVARLAFDVEMDA